MLDSNIDILEHLEETTIDWEDIDKVNALNGALLKRIAEPGNLSKLIANARATPSLARMCERHNLFNRLVLHSADERGFRIRLHIYHEPKVETIHDHRFPFTAYLLNGSYLHTRYAPKEDFYDTYDPNAPDSSDQISLNEENFDEVSKDMLETGQYYTIDSDIYHTVQANPHTVSLMLRGPAKKDFCLFVSPKDGGVSNCVSAAEESEAMRAEKVLSDNEIEQTVQALARMNLI